MIIRFGLKTGCDNTRIRMVLAHGAIPNLGADLAPLRVPPFGCLHQFWFLKRVRSAPWAVTLPEDTTGQEANCAYHERL
jgi:hypothetical protein